MGVLSTFGPLNFIDENVKLLLSYRSPRCYPSPCIKPRLASYTPRLRDLTIPPPLQDLPPEFVLCTGNQINSAADLNALIRANRRLWALLQPHLTKFPSPVKEVEELGKGSRRGSLVEMGEWLRIVAAVVLVYFAWVEGIVLAVLWGGSSLYHDISFGVDWFTGSKFVRLGAFSSEFFSAVFSTALFSGIDRIARIPSFSAVDSRLTLTDNIAGLKALEVTDPASTPDSAMAPPSD
ncbi:hypothetical protein L873DRAFT_1848769 [Choiromyces venosus 120613-1]|uniref:Uncharacterized protein n=1 Tax=Choiromyces venosus 120613-1 TaxID=1336337 RepID=A0A3N4IWH2_9PEZI|nr:hypothetical protein L873DRAFT_1848769 [Choiromyces venosus 120613-1]